MHSTLTVLIRSLASGTFHTTCGASGFSTKVEENSRVPLRGYCLTTNQLQTPVRLSTSLQLHTSSTCSFVFSSKAQVLSGTTRLLCARLQRQHQVTILLVNSANASHFQCFTDPVFQPGSCVWLLHREQQGTDSKAGSVPREQFKGCL